MRTIVTICLLAITFTPSPVSAGDRVVARVGSEAITNLELASALAQNPDIVRSKALDLLIERRLILNWAAGKNISIVDEEVEQVETSIRERNNLTPDQFQKALISKGESVESFRENIREQLTVNKALGMALSAEAKVSESELQELYLKTYPRETVFEVSHILLSVDKEASDEEGALVKENAEQILAEISGGASFESMASKYSQDGSSADKSGRLGTFREGELLPELEKLAAGLEPGGVGGPVRTSAGYHILLLASRGQSDPPPFAEVKSILERNLMVDREKSIRTRWLKELKETTYIEIFPDDG
jgi:peptidyl-prolyl cis-trans isomerase SurA